MSVADLEGARDDGSLPLELQTSSSNYAIGGPPRTPVHDAAAELNASLDISGSTESDVAERSNQNDEFGPSTEGLPRTPRSDDSPVSVDMTAIVNRKRANTEAVSDESSSSTSSSSGEQSESATSREGSDEESTEDGTDETSPNTVVCVGDTGGSNDFGSIGMGDTPNIDDVAADPTAEATDTNEALEVPETPASPTDDGNEPELLLPSYPRGRYVSEQFTEETHQQQSQVREELDSSNEDGGDDEEVDDENENYDNEYVPVEEEKPRPPLTHRDPRQRLMMRPPSPPPNSGPPPPMLDPYLDEIESISSASDEGGSSSGEDDEEEEEDEEDELDNTSLETVTATETTDVEGDLPKKEIEVNTEKIYFIRRRDGTVHSGEVLEKRTVEDSSTVEYYVHYKGLNRRLDEWVGRHRISDNLEDLGGITVTSQPSADQPGTSQVRPNRPPNTDYYLSAYKSQQYDFSDRKMTRYQKRRYDEINHVQKGYTGLSAAQEALEKEHDALTKIKYIVLLQFGKYLMYTWYFSPYPDEYRKVRKLYVCEYCLKYMRLEDTYRYHMSSCKRTQPPGREIYRKGTISIYEIDGSKELLYCQLLSLMAKLFLHHKVLFYDMAPFYFYVLCEIDEKGRHLVGYFSKEKNSLENNNVACILVMPPHQRKGYGKLLIAFSYELSRKEGIIGSPEKPLSDMGRLSYRSYWGYTLLELMKECRTASQSIKALSEMSGITQDDIIYTLQSMKMIKYWKGQHVICVTPKTINEYLQLPQFKRPKLTIDLNCLDWKPHNVPPTKIGLPPPQ